MIHQPASRLRRAVTLAALALTFALASTGALAQTPAGKIEWNVEGKPALDFAPKTALGLYVKTSGNFVMMFFAEALKPEESNYWLARQSSILRGKFEGKAFKPDDAMNQRLNALAAQSVMLWGDLKDQSKPAKASKTGALPAVHEAKDLTGLMVCVSHNCSYHSGGVYGDEYAPQIKALRVPTPAGAASKQTAMVDVAINKGEAGKPAKTIMLKGELPFYIVHE